MGSGQGWSGANCILWNCKGKIIVHSGEAAAGTDQKEMTRGGIDINAIGEFEGHSILDFDLDGQDDKPWRKPGADITDYFNFGFNETTWRAYVFKQRSLREEFRSSSKQEYDRPSVQRESSRYAAAPSRQSTSGRHTSSRDHSPSSRYDDGRYGDRDRHRESKRRRDDSVDTYDRDRERDRYHDRGYHDNRYSGYRRRY